MLGNLRYATRFPKNIHRSYVVITVKYYYSTHSISHPNLFLAPGSGNHKYCSTECKKASKTNKRTFAQHPKHNNKRDITVLSPQDTNSKLLIGQPCLLFHDAFGSDIDTIIGLDKADLLSKFQSFFNTISETGKAGKQASI